MSTPISSTTSSSNTSSGTQSTATTQQNNQATIQALLQQLQAGPTITFGGLISGINTQQIVQALLAINQAPILQLQDQQAQEQLKLASWQQINTQLSVLQQDASTLGLQSTIGAKKVAFGGPSGTYASGTALTTAATGSFQLQIDQLATPTKATSTQGIGTAIVGTDIATVTSKLSTPVTVGAFTVNGHQINVTAGEDFNTILANISTQTGGTVTGTVVNNTIQLTSTNGQPILLGSAGDTSNFLSAVKLLGQPAALTITSAGPVGVANSRAFLDSANLAGLISTSNGAISVNGVTITYNTATDTLNDVLGRINSSAAGVTATYDSTSDTVTFTSSKTGNIDISLADAGGNLLRSLNIVTVAQSTSNLGAAIVGTDDATASSKLPTPVTAGTFTVSGAQITVTAGETFDSILADIQTQTGGNVTGAIVGDTIQLTSNNNQAIQLGDAADTSNFLTVTKLAGQSGGLTATSSGPVGAANTGVALDSANLVGLQSTATGSMVVNGVTINYDTTADTLTALIQRINGSAAGVTASYDATSDTISLVSNGSISISDTSGNLGATLHLPASVASTHQLGQSAKYEVNGGPAQYSLTNTVNNVVPGVNVTLQAVTPAGSPVVGTVTLDPSVGTKAIQTFVTDYNALVDILQQDTAYDPDTKHAGIFLGDPTIAALQQQLDEALFVSNGAALGLTEPYVDVSTIGLNTGPIGSAPGTTSHLQFDSTTLSNALEDNPSAVSLLVNTVFGNLSKQLLDITAPFGVIDSAIQSENTQIRDIQSEIDTQQQLLQQQQDALTAEFNALDQQLATLQSQSAAGASILAALAGGSAAAATTSSSSGSSSG